jgi:hypothetical protein
MTSPDQLADTDRASLDAILAVSAELAACAASVRPFVTGLRADQDADTNV